MACINMAQASEKMLLSITQIRQRVDQYGFIEFASILKFIEYVCSSPPDIGDYSFIRAKVRLCLQHHDDGSDYFIAIREFASELDALITF
jgi:hypothetical protein